MPRITGMAENTKDLIEDRARELAEAAPPLTAEQRDELSVLLRRC